jgi:hypothetical protein
MKVQPRNTLTTITAPRCFALRTAAITVGRKYSAAPSRTTASRNIIANLPSRPPPPRYWPGCGPAWRCANLLVTVW